MRRKKLSTSYSPENRGHSRQDAQDLTQDFFVHISRAGSQRGRFRNFLLGALEHFLANAGERACAIKRGGGCQWIFFLHFFFETSRENSGRTRLRHAEWTLHTSIPQHPEEGVNRPSEEHFSAITIKYLSSRHLERNK
jgi:hypothetical protein